MPVKDLIEFILYLAPGFIATELYIVKYPARDRSQFVQITWSIICGIIILTFVKWIDQKYFGFALDSAKEGFPSFYFITALFVSGFLLGIIRIAWREIRFNLAVNYDIFKFIAPDPKSTWAKINETNDIYWAVVFLNDKSIYLGGISNYTYDPNNKNANSASSLDHYNENQDFLLSNARRVNERLKLIYSIDGKGVYLNTRNVNRIELIKGKSE